MIPIGPPERLRGDGPGLKIKASPAACAPEDLCDHLGGVSLAGHANAKPGIVEPASSHRPDSLQHLVLPVGEVLLQPVLKQARDREWQANDACTRPIVPRLARQL